MCCVQGLVEPWKGLRHNHGYHRMQTSSRFGLVWSYYLVTQCCVTFSGNRRAAAQKSSKPEVSSSWVKLLMQLSGHAPLRGPGEAQEREQGMLHTTKPLHSRRRLGRRGRSGRGPTHHPQELTKHKNLTRRRKVGPRVRSKVPCELRIRVQKQSRKLRVSCKHKRLRPKQSDHDSIQWILHGNHTESAGTRHGKARRFSWEWSIF